MLLKDNHTELPKLPARCSKFLRAPANELAVLTVRQAYSSLLPEGTTYTNFQRIKLYDYDREDVYYRTGVAISLGVSDPRGWISTTALESPLLLPAEATAAWLMPK